MDHLTPPVELIAQNNVGIHDKENILAEYRKIGTYLFTVLKNRAGVRPDSDILDMGCGLGRVAAPFTTYLTSGSYTGVDVVKSSIDWCAERYSGLPNFRFIHADLYSEFYNPKATVSAENYRFPFEDGSFDVVWSSSLFTHMLFDAVDNYLGEMSRVLKPGGRIWNSYLLLDEISEPLVHGRPRSDGRRMEHEVKGGRVGWKDKPEWVVGLRLDGINELHRKHGLEIVETQLSNWSGGREDVPYKGQDVIIARKAS
ncbi:class I SAM-dependent methyltransferase [Mesorhizobium xinjiangense]|uniref:class I SAM-dependent methyltransferase n=1 Tax=Mesorhizobium xinjiangense TaxID=2678685 RepID=UPI0012ECD14E|nr:class I SAM-dependent methyltransferase [Mesorhizobium xinjiangense]